MDKQANQSAFIGQLALQLAKTHTEASLILASTRFLASFAEIEWAELVVLTDARASRALRASPGAEVATPRRPLVLPPGESDNEPVILRPRSDSKLVELRNAHQRGLRVLVVLPLRSCDSNEPRSPGRVVFALRKPSPTFSDDELLGAVRDVLSAALATCHAFARVGEVSRRAHVASRELKDALELRKSPTTIIARSPAMRRLVDEVIPQAARHDVSVLLLGESGVGKELLAAEIHRRSRRAGRPMLAINCGALPEALVDSALFGHESGAFTGADRRYAGVFERAHRATLFLDEVGELSAATQAKLLRVLDSGELQRVGSASSMRVDVRIIAATNRDLGEMVNAGTFRLDLFHRLALVQLTVPPLRERLDDIDVLVPALLQRIASRSNTPLILPTPAQMRALRAYRWPGNVRELENTLARALLFAERGVLAVEATLGDAARSKSRDEVPSFAEASRRSIEVALAASGGRIHGSGGAAALLKLKPTTLKSKMQKLGIASKRQRAPGVRSR